MGMKDINIQSVGGRRGYTTFDREISKAQFNAAIANGGRVTKEDEAKILDYGERFGYGASLYNVFEQGGKYYVHVHRWNNCD